MFGKCEATSLRNFLIKFGFLSTFADLKLAGQHVGKFVYGPIALANRIFFLVGRLDWTEMVDFIKISLEIIA